MRRREFLKNTGVTGGAFVLGISEARTGANEVPSALLAAGAVQLLVNALPDLAPARWIWYPFVRCLANTFVLFRRSLELPSAPDRATGWISADSRYLLEANGQRTQWVSAPCDSRWFEADPIDLTGLLEAGSNALRRSDLPHATRCRAWRNSRRDRSTRSRATQGDHSAPAATRPQAHAPGHREWRVGAGFRRQE